MSRITRSLDALVRQFHRERLRDDYGYLFLDGVSLRMRRPAGRKRVHMLVAYGVRQDGTRHLLAFLRSRGESQADWEGLLEDLYRRGLEGKKLLLIVTDGCPGLAAAIQTVYPRVAHQRCWVHKMRNILEHVRKRDYDEVKRGAQAIYRGESRAQAQAAFRWCSGLPETRPQGRLVRHRFETKETPLQLKLSNRIEDGVLVLDCVGRIVFGDESAYLRDTVKQLLLEYKRIVMNLGEVNYIDSGGLGTLVALYTSATSAGASIKLASLTKRVGDLLQVTKLLTVFEVYDTEEKALQAFRAAA